MFESMRDLGMGASAALFGKNLAGSYPYCCCYARNFIAGTVMYHAVSYVWAQIVYGIMKARPWPDAKVVAHQVRTAQAALVVYAAVPTLSEYLISEDYTASYWFIKDAGGWTNHAIYTLTYVSLVEMGVYWVHRTLHRVPLLYRRVHGTHHQYSTPESMTPWASIAFNPLDGLAQASPYLILLPVVPCHSLVHLGLLFFTAVWATNIHDGFDFEPFPVMGAKYHTVHHTHHHYNFGQFFVFCDWYWGTLSQPPTFKNRTLKSHPTE